MRKRIFFLLLTLLALFGAGWNSVEALAQPPLAVGNRWVYSPSYGDGVRVDRIIGTEMINGTLAYIWKRVEASPDNYHEKMWITRVGSGMKLLKFWSNMGPDPAISFEPILISPADVALDDEFEYVMDFGIARVKVTARVESMGAAVTVPAGAFENCVVIKIKTEITKDGETDIDYDKTWSCPGVGDVIMRDYSENWETPGFSQELTEFSNAGDFHVDISTSQDRYGREDTLKAYISIYNGGACQMADIYLVFQDPNGGLGFFPEFSAVPKPVLPEAINICGSPFVSDLVFYQRTFTPEDSAGTHAIHGLLTKPGSNPIDTRNWLSIDSAPYNVE